MIDINKFSGDLLAWYDEHARILPWREEVTPYRVWVSEIMLQQTRVEAVKPYFKRFMDALPTLADLAVVEDDKLKKLWEGLGYYNRVVNMKRCAMMCIERFNGRLPSTYEDLLTLPGIGAYTAGAIASIAYKRPVAAVDGNVLRVFSRLLMSEDDIAKEATKKKFQTLITTYIPKDHPDTFNQALMEIGALICIPTIPRCNLCPLIEHCLGYKMGAAQRLPNKARKKARVIEHKTVLVFVYKNEVRIQKRADTGLLAGLYEFVNEDEYYSEKQLQSKLAKTDEILKIEKLADSKHIFTHKEWHMKGYLIILSKKSEGMFVPISALQDTYALPTAYKTYSQALYQYWEGYNGNDI